MYDPDRVTTTCEQCGQTDLAPKQHIMAGPHGDKTAHFDCLSVAEKSLVGGSDPRIQTIVDACASGTQNEDLFDLIQEVVK